MERSGGRGRGTALTTVGVLVALAVVALAAREGVSAGDPRSRRPADGLLDAAFSLFLVSLAVGTVAFVVLLILNRDALRSLDADHRRRSSRRTIVMVVLAVIALALIVRSVGGREGELELPQLQGTPTGDAAPQSDPSEQTYEPEFAWLPVAIVGLLAAAGIAAAWWSAKRRRKARGEGAELTFAEALDDVLAETLDDLRAETDPRRAVIAAYARLERALAAYGLPRRPAEAPLEYLERMLESAEVTPAAGRRLTVLFERARFSQHEVEPEMKDEAIGALETVRDDLRLAELRAEQARAEALELARERAASL